jgi:hypothetical protein
MGLGPDLPILSHGPIISHVGYPVGYPISFRLVSITLEEIFLELFIIGTIISNYYKI